MPPLWLVYGWTTIRSTRCSGLARSGCPRPTCSAASTLSPSDGACSRRRTGLAGEVRMEGEAEQALLPAGTHLVPMSRNDLEELAALHDRIRPACSRTNSRPLPSPAFVTNTGCFSPSTTSCSSIPVSAGRSRRRRLGRPEPDRRSFRHAMPLSHGCSARGLICSTAAEVQVASASRSPGRRKPPGAARLRTCTRRWAAWRKPRIWVGRQPGLGRQGMDLGLAGKKAIITGGSKGIGRAIAETLAAEGCHVAICARDEDGVAAAVGALKGKGSRRPGARSTSPTGRPSRAGSRRALRSSAASTSWSRTSARST